MSKKKRNRESTRNAHWRKQQKSQHLSHIEIIITMLNISAYMVMMTLMITQRARIRSTHQSYIEHAYWKCTRTMYLYIYRYIFWGESERMYEIYGHFQLPSCNMHFDIICDSLNFVSGFIQLVAVLFLFCGSTTIVSSGTVINISRQ